MVAGYWLAGEGSKYIMSELFRRAVVELVKDLLEVSILLCGESSGSPGRVARSLSLYCGRSFTIFPESLMESRIFFRKDMRVGIPRT